MLKALRITKHIQRITKPGDSFGDFQDAMNRKLSRVKKYIILLVLRLTVHNQKLYIFSFYFILKLL